MTKLKNLWRNLVRMLEPPTIAALDSEPAPMKISSMALARAGTRADSETGLPRELVKYKPAPGVVPADAKSDPTFLATDDAMSQTCSYAAGFYGMCGFAGYPYLANLNQISEYRSPCETTAMEMTRKWIKLVTHGDGDKSDRMEKIEAALKRHGVREIFQRAALLDGQMGHGQVFIDIKGQETDDARKLPLIVDKATIKAGSLVGFKVIEPTWTTPYAYNSNDPIAADFYKPRAWFVLGKITHASRLLSFISRPVPDILKPAYNFGGLSMTQLMEPYVNNWLRTRDSVNTLISTFCITGVATDMGDTLAGGTGDNLFARMKLWNQTRDNQGVMLLNRETEEMFQFNANLGTLDKLQAQAQEHMAAPSHTPMLKLLGVTPSGLNASSESELDVYDDYIAAMQENLFRAPLKTVIDIIQLDEFGDIDESIGFEFVPMKQLDGTALAAIRKSDTDGAVALINAGVLDPVEERARLATDPNSGYGNIDVDKVPEPIEDPDSKPNDGMKDDDE